MDINSRLRMVREDHGSSQAKFANLLGLPQSTYAQYELNKRSVPDELKQQLAAMGIDIHWLVTGEGSMHKDQAAGPAAKTPAMVVMEPEHASYNKNKGLAVISKDEETIPIPLIRQKLSAGPGQLWGDDCFTDDVIAIPTRMVKRFQGYKLGAAEVRGDSMDPSLQNGDTVFFAEKMISGNGIYALSIDEEVYVKRLEFDPFEGTIRVISDNSKYDPKLLPADTDRIRILGKIIGRLLVYW